MSRCLAPLLLALVLVTPLTGQTQVSGLRDLTFGAVIRGVQTTVAPSDPVKSGRFYVRYVLGGRIQVRFTLPTTLARVGGGATLPISFQNSDGLAQGTAPSSPPISFNPKATTNFNLTTSADANFWLGGRVSPTATQVTGTYRGTIAVNVVFF